MFLYIEFIFCYKVATEKRAALRSGRVKKKKYPSLADPTPCTLDIWNRLCLSFNESVPFQEKPARSAVSSAADTSVSVSTPYIRNIIGTGKTGSHAGGRLRNQYPQMAASGLSFPIFPKKPAWLANLEDCTERRNG